jgi:hypothetical protein
MPFGLLPDVSIGLWQHQFKCPLKNSVDTLIVPTPGQNVNLNGRYEFLKKVAPLNVDIIIRELTGLGSPQKACG